MTNFVFWAWWQFRYSETPAILLLKSPNIWRLLFHSCICHVFILNPMLLAFLLRVSVHLDDGVSPIILQLAQAALCSQQIQPLKRSGKASSPVKAARKEKSKSQEPDGSESEDFCFILVNHVSERWHLVKQATLIHEWNTWYGQW